MTYNDITKYKRTLRRELTVEIIFIVFWSIMLGLLILPAFKTPQTLLICIPFSLLLALFLHFNARTRSIMKQLNTIEQNKLINKYREVKLYRPKVTLLQKYRFRRSFTANEYYGFYLTDKDRNKYFYLFYESNRISNEYFKGMQEKLWRELTLQCCEGTNIIRTIENDPHFLF